MRLSSRASPHLLHLSDVRASMSIVSTWAVFPALWRTSSLSVSASWSWPLLTDCWFCCRSSAGQRAVWIATSLRPRCWRGAPPNQQQETPGTRGFPDNQIKPTHSLSASDMLLYPPPPSSVDWTSLWVTMKFWTMSSTKYIDKMTTLTSSPCPALGFLALITGADDILLAQNDIPQFHVVKTVLIELISCPGH